jgi:hypothetical protein
MDSQSPTPECWLASSLPVMVQSTPNRDGSQSDKVSCSDKASCLDKVCCFDEVLVD